MPLPAALRLSPARRAILRAVVACAAIGWVPGQARGPLDGDRMIAGLRTFYHPRDNLQAIDVALLGRARESIDIAAFILTNRAVIEALASAAVRGVRVRVYLDPDQASLRSGRSFEALTTLARTPGVEIRVKTGETLMHLKAYQIDRRVLRTGSANFSHTGLTRQDNDILVIESQEAVARFLREFEDYWRRPDNLVYRGGAPIAAIPGRAPPAAQGAPAND